MNKLKVSRSYFQRCSSQHWGEYWLYGSVAFTGIHRALSQNLFVAAPKLRPLLLQHIIIYSLNLQP